MMKLSYLVIALSTGCMINGKPMLGSGGSPAASSASTGGAEGAAIAPAAGGDDAARVRDLYQRFTFNNVAFPDATTQFSKMGISSSFNPRRKMENVDPAWIPGWDSLSLTDESQTAVLQAAVNRSWQQHAHADYAAYRKAWAAIEAELRPQLAAALELGEYHTRGVALAKVYVAANERANAAGIQSSSDLRYVGFMYEITRAMVDLHEAANTGFRLTSYLTSLNIPTRDLQASMRPFAAGDTERDLFTASRLDDLPKLNEYGKAFAAVKWPVDARAARATRTTLIAEATASLGKLLANAVPNIPSVFDGSSGDPRDPALRWFGSGGVHKPVTVAKVARKGSGAEVQLLGATERQIPYGCKDTKQWKVGTDNTIRPIQDCNYKTVTTRYTFDVTFAALPDGVTLEKGDELDLYGDIVSQQSAKNAHTFKVTARAIATIKRDGKELVKFW